MPGEYIILSGGVGGAKLVAGMQQVLAADAFSVVANTGDDFNHLGLPISPDIDTLMYTLAGIANTTTGWGQKNESWNFMAALEKLDGDTWFRLGDKDLATHIKRRELLAAGLTLTAATQCLCEQLGVDIRILPMSDDPVRTKLETSAGTLSFQDYFVRRKAEPLTQAIHYSGNTAAQPSAEIAAALSAPTLRGIIIGPSNPWLSIDPILSINALKPMISARNIPVVAISPIVGGAAIKGPAAKIMSELGIDVSARGIASHYSEIIDGLIIDNCDTELQEAIAANGIEVGVTQTVMRDTADKAALARYTIEFLDTLSD
jgi:LPPG:FO 2-phospho-L-lactate transferase